jgi:hypothetical protein
LKKVIHRGASYILWLEDDYFSRCTQKSTAEVRMQLAHLVVAVTPMLRERILQLYPDKKVICLEEPIDVERLKPKKYSKIIQGHLVWCGRLWNLKILLLDEFLKKFIKIPLH